MTELKTLKNTRHHADHANADSVGATPGTTLIATVVSCSQSTHYASYVDINLAGTQ